MILYRCGHFSDNNLSKGNYWSNFITECKPYYRGKISVIEIQLDERYHKRYMLSKELKTLGSHDGWENGWELIRNIMKRMTKNIIILAKNI